MCYQEGQNIRTSYYCSLCTLTSNTDADRKATNISIAVSKNIIALLGI